MKNLFFFKPETTQTLLFKELMKHIDKSVITKRVHVGDGLDITTLQAKNQQTDLTVKFIREEDSGWRPAYKVYSNDECYDIADKVAKRLFNEADKRYVATSHTTASDKEKAAEAATVAAKKAQEFLNQLSNSNNYRGR